MKRADSDTATNLKNTGHTPGRNWLFSCTAEGVSASECIYSLIETVKANGLEPYWYLKYLF